MIRAWGATAVVTLMEQHELDMLDVGGIGGAVEENGMDWLHLPVGDLDVPDKHFERRWVILAGASADGFATGKSPHPLPRGTGSYGNARRPPPCRDRNGAGDCDSDHPARPPGTIENGRQERHVLSCRTAQLDDWRGDRVLGCLMGGAVGDAFGYEVEFDGLDAIRRRFGPQGITEPVLHNGRLIVSDDTQMTLFTAMALPATIGEIESEDAMIERIQRFYLTWYRTQCKSYDQNATGILGCRELWARRAPGTTCQSALAAGGNGSPERRINHSKGCGGVMRVAPIGLVAGMDGDAAFRLGARAAALTHGHPSGFLSAAAMAGIIADVLVGDELERAIGSARRGWPTGRNIEETLAAIDMAVSLARSRCSHDEALRLLGGGWVGEEALAIALYGVLVSSSFREAIRVAANHDGDSNSTASIAGQIWGAAYGLDELPPNWVANSTCLARSARWLAFSLSERLRVATSLGRPVGKVDRTGIGVARRPVCDAFSRDRESKFNGYRCHRL